MKINKQMRTLSLLGFCGTEDLFNSLFKPDSALLILSFSFMATMIEFVFGLKLFAFTALFILLIVELASGLFASRLKGRKITSRRMQRFGVMVLIWFTLLMVMNAFVFQFKGCFEEYIFHYIHSLMIFYIIGVYTKSILENAETIWKNKMNAKSLIKNIFKVLPVDDDKK